MTRGNSPEVGGGGEEFRKEEAESASQARPVARASAGGREGRWLCARVCRRRGAVCSRLVQLRLRSSFALRPRAPLRTGPPAFRGVIPRRTPVRVVVRRAPIPIRIIAQIAVVVVTVITPLARPAGSRRAVIALPRIGLGCRPALWLFWVVNIDVQAKLNRALVSAGLLELLEISVKGVRCRV